MQNADTPRTKRPAPAAPPANPSLATLSARRIDCGMAPDDRPAQARPERSDVRHGYLTSRGMYADQVQAI